VPAVSAFSLMSLNTATPFLTRALLPSAAVTLADTPLPSALMALGSRVIYRVTSVRTLKLCTLAAF